jgi:hypothetical protein
VKSLSSRLHVVLSLAFGVPYVFRFCIPHMLLAKMAAVTVIYIFLYSVSCGRNETLVCIQEVSELGYNAIHTQTKHN